MLLVAIMRGSPLPGHCGRTANELYDENVAAKPIFYFLLGSDKNFP